MTSSRTNTLTVIEVKFGNWVLAFQTLHKYAVLNAVLELKDRKMNSHSLSFKKHEAKTGT